MNASIPHERPSWQSESLRYPDVWDGLRPSLTHGQPVAPPSLPRLERSRAIDRAERARRERRGELALVRRGVRMAQPLGPGTPTHLEELILATALGMTLGTPAVLSHLTAARRIGLWTPPGDDRVHLTQPFKVSPEARRDDRIFRHVGATPGADLRSSDGLLITSVERTVVDCARILPFPDALQVADSALVIGASRGVMLAIVERLKGYRGVRTARLVCLQARPCGSPAESTTRGDLIMLGIPAPTTLIRVKTANGVREVDLGWEELKYGVEVHGAAKYRAGADPLREAKKREDLFRAGWTILDVRTDQPRRARAQQIAQGYQVALRRRRQV